MSGLQLSQSSIKFTWLISPLAEEHRSFVSKSWLPRSRYHLFHTKLLWHRVEPWTFVALLHAPLSTITPYVRDLRLHETWGRCTFGPWLNAALPRLTVLSAITSFFVKGARFEVLETEDTTKFFGSFQMLREWSLVGCTFATPEYLIGVLGAIPSLEYLRLDGVDLSINRTWGFGAVAKSEGFIQP
jgi:hypothetical protein